MVFFIEKDHVCTTGVVPACATILFGMMSLPAFGQVAVGLVGITRDSASGMPVAEAQITAHSLAKSTKHVAVTDADGIFTFTGLSQGFTRLRPQRVDFRCRRRTSKLVRNEPPV